MGCGRVVVEMLHAMLIRDLPHLQENESGAVIPQYRR
jgi:hypothetical protein